MDIYFDGVPQSVRFIRCEPLLEMVLDVFPTWPLRIENCGSTSTPVITVRHLRGEYRINAPWLDEAAFADTELGAFSNIVVDLIYAWLATNIDALCLHCAAVEFGKRLVLFPNMSKAGKSTLAARLMAEGHNCYGDDLVALTQEGEGMSFGVPPRLRLPLPASEKAVVDFVSAHGGKADNRYQYINPAIR